MFGLVEDAVHEFVGGDTTRSGRIESFHAWLGHDELHATGVVQTRGAGAIEMDPVTRHGEHATTRSTAVRHMSSHMSDPDELDGGRRSVAPQRAAASSLHVATNQAVEVDLQLMMVSASILIFVITADRQRS
jgi:hypothetical protein